MMPDPDYRVLPQKNELYTQYKHAMNADFAAMVTEAKMEGGCLCYPNQVKIGKAVAAVINQELNILFQIVYASTQVGKTGCMVSIIRQLTKMPFVPVNPKHVFVITGLSDTEWLTQTKARMPSYVSSDNVIHRGNFKSAGKRIAEKKDVLVFIDEGHLANKEDMSLDKLTKVLCLKDAHTMCARNLNVVFFTATPNQLLCDIQTQVWSDERPRWKKHVLRPGPGYVGIPDLVKSGRVLQHQDFYIDDDPTEQDMQSEAYKAQARTIRPAIDAIRDLRDFISNRYAPTDPRYHIVRTPVGHRQAVVIRRFKMLCGGVFGYQKCDSTTDTAVLQIIAHRPQQHTILFIKEQLRCAVTLKPKCHVGVLYERQGRCVIDGTIVQALLGRTCGYDNDDGMVVFTNVESARRYMSLLENDFDDIGDFKCRGSCKPTFIERSTWAGEHSATCPQKGSMENREWKVFPSDEEAIDYAQHTFGINLSPQKAAADTLCDADGNFPTKEYIIKRWWGISARKAIRKVPLCTNQWMLWWDNEMIQIKDQ